jgi:hypothetical protein
VDQKARREATLLTSYLRRFALNRTPIALGLLVVTSLSLTSSVGWAITGFPQFYESLVSKNCSANNCFINLAIVPTGAVLQATNITCNLGTSTAGSPITVIKVNLLQGPLASAQPKESFFVNAANPTSTINVFDFHQEIRTFFAAGTRPVVAFLADGATQTSLTCKISGDIIRP